MDIDTKTETLDLPPRISGAEMALRWAEETICKAAETKGELIGALAAGRKDDIATQTMYKNLLAQQGAAVGVVQTLFRLGYLSETAYSELMFNAKTLQINQTAIVKVPKKLTILTTKI